MKMLGIHGKRRKNERYHSYKGEVGKVADNILNRDFTAERAFEKLATDATQLKVRDTKIYLSPIMDLYNNEIMSYSVSLHPDLAQIREMLDGLSKKLPQGATPILHSDQGWQYQHAEYQRYLKEHNIVQSMSRKGNCMDNGAMECFFGRLKVEMFYGEKFTSVDGCAQRALYRRHGGYRSAWRLAVFCGTDGVAVSHRLRVVCLLHLPAAQNAVQRILAPDRHGELFGQDRGRVR